MEEFWGLLEARRLLPLLTPRGGEDLGGLARVLKEEGLPLVEVALRTPGALEAVARLRAEGLLVGAGTVRSPEQAEAAWRAGAEFLVSPGLSEAVARWAQERGIAYLPGVLTPTEVERALGLGLRVLKFFPAKAFQGARVLRAYAEVFPEAQFVPTGGLGREGVGAYLRLPNVLACGGSWLFAGGTEGLRVELRAFWGLLGG